MNNVYGELAALTTALCWAFGSVLFTIGGSRIGSANVNRGRLVIALVFLSCMHLFLTGSLFPIEATPSQWFWLGLSGIVGFIIGDGMLFEAFILIGPRLSMLLMSLVPIISAILGWLFFRETLNMIEIAAIIIAVGGVIWVVSDKRRENKGSPEKRLLSGIALGFGGAMGQAIGLLLSKKGLEGGFSALSGNIIRVLSAVIILWLITAMGGKIRSTLSSYRDRKAVLALCGGSLFGPFIGVWLSLISITYAKLGIATTLMSLTPIFLIPITRIVFGEKITFRAVTGTIIAIAGVILLISI